MSKLNAQQRNALPSQDFAGPGRSYPIPDANHARAALTDVSRVGTPDQKAQIRRAVAMKYPGIKQSKRKSVYDADGDGQ